MEITSGKLLCCVYKPSCRRCSFWATMMWKRRPDRALQKVVIGMLADHTELFKQFSDNPSFKKWLGDTIFGVTYEESAV
jgi:hypothetical protein